MISVIISTYKSEKYIKTCIDAVLKSRDVNFEIIRVDCGKNSLGLTVTHNMGAKLAVGEYLLFLDVDTKLDKKALSEIVKFFEKHEDVGAIQGKIETTGHFLSIFGFPYEVNDGRKVIFGARTACMAIRRELFNKIGGFDEDYFMHGEETDLCWRVWLAGYKIYYLPKVKCVHYGKSHYLSSRASDPSVILSEASAKSKDLWKIAQSLHVPKIPPLSASWRIGRDDGVVPNVHDRIFYEGAKNQITTILKDAPLSLMVFMLPLNILAWMIVSAGASRRAPTIWVYKGIVKALFDINKTLKKRKKVIRADGNEARKVMFGDMDFISLMLKGFNWLRSL